MLPFDPKKPLYGFTARFPHAKRRIHVFADDGFAYFRPKNAPDDWWGTTMQSVSQFREFLSTRNRWRRGRQLRIPEYAVWRVFFLRDPRSTETRLWQIARCSSGGYVIPVGHPKELDGAFFCSSEKVGLSSIRTSTAQLRAQFEREWNNPDSDVRAALDWCDLSYEERQWRSIVWQRGGRDELERVARAACILEMEDGWQDGQSLRLGISVYHHSISPNGVSMSAQAWHSGWRASSEHRITRVFSRLQERSQAVVDYPTGARDDAIFAWSPDDPLDPSYVKADIEIQIEPPTQHERLEAALFLRNWLAQNALDLLDDWFAS